MIISIQAKSNAHYSHRLDRLFILLESGSSAVTRRAAAKQIGEVQKLYPNELHRLLNRLIGYLHSTSWDTRIAAAQAVDAILQNVPVWQPEATVKRELHLKHQSTVIPPQDDESSCFSSDSNATTNTMASTSTVNDLPNKDSYLTFAEFNLEQILKRGALLFGSEGVEFDYQEDNSGSELNIRAIDSTERLNRQRALLNEKLGLTQANKLGINLTHLITNEDVMHNCQRQSSSTGNKSSIKFDANTDDAEKIPVQRILRVPLPASKAIGSHSAVTNNYRKEKSGVPQQSLSCREINRAKRKARQNMSTNTAASLNGSVEEPEKKKLKAQLMGGSSSSSSVTDDPGQLQPEIFYCLKGSISKERKS